jgi:hypothetical protein
MPARDRLTCPGEHEVAERRIRLIRKKHDSRLVVGRAKEIQTQERDREQTNKGFTANEQNTKFSSLEIDKYKKSNLLLKVQL